MVTNMNNYLTPFKNMREQSPMAFFFVIVCETVAMGENPEALRPPVLYSDREISKRQPASDDTNRLAVIVPFRDLPEKLSQGAGRSGQPRVFASYM